MEAASKLIEAIAHLIGVLAWPAVAVFLAIRFAQPVRDFLASLGEGSLKVFGVEASAKKVAVASIAAAQTEKLGQTEVNPELSPEETSDTLAQSARLITSSTIRESSRKLILWVDDMPEGNVNERRALRAIGFKIWKAQTTENALAFLQDGNKPDLIISDLARPEDPQAGFDLLKKSKVKYFDIPFIIYSGKYKSALRQEALRYGAFGYTSDPAKLIELVLKATNMPSVFG